MDDILAALADRLKNRKTDGVTEREDTGDQWVPHSTPAKPIHVSQLLHAFSTVQANKQQQLHDQHS